MTREQFDNLKVGDYVRHAFGHVGIVTEKDNGMYVVKDKGFDTGDGCDKVSFAWNEGEPVSKEEGMKMMFNDSAVNRFDPVIRPGGGYITQAEREQAKKRNKKKRNNKRK